MESKTWTFGTLTGILEGKQIHDLGGIYYMGASDVEFLKIAEPLIGEFSDGTKWEAEVVLPMLGQNVTSQHFEGIRRLAGKYEKDMLNTLAFNNAVPGTCMVIMRNAVKNEEKGNLYYQFKGYNSSWTSRTVISGDDEISEIKIHATIPGSFWISAGGSIQIIAVRFVADESIPLVTNRQKPTVLEALSDNLIFADFNKDAFGKIEITAEGGSIHDTLTVHMGECIKDGHVDREPGGARRYECIKIPLQEGLNICNPSIPLKMYYNGLYSLYMPKEIGEVMPYRYCEIEKNNPNIVVNNINRLSVNYKFDDDASYFHCDNDILNQIWDMCKHSIKATSFMGYYIDGDRERQPYEADALINQLGHYANDTEFSMARRTMDYLLRIPTWPTEWIMQTVLMAWNDFLFSGDISFFNQHKDVLYSHSLMNFVNPEVGLVSTTAVEQTEQILRLINKETKIEDIVDWPHGSEDDGFEYTDYNTVVNAYHYEVVKRLAQLYDALGDSEKKKKLEDYCANFAKIFNNSFFDKERGIYKDGLSSSHASLHANMFALCFGLVPSEYLESVTNYVVSRGMSCSVYGAQFLLDALYEVGDEKAAFSLLTSKDKRSWMNMINEGSTISMESWSNELKANQDWNHAWGAAPANIIPFRLMGIRPIVPGFTRAEIKPQLAGLTEAECKVPTIHGSIYVEIGYKTDEYVMSVIIPSSILCDVYVPATQPFLASVFLDNEQIDNYTIENEKYIKIALISGNHEIRLKQNATGVNPNVIRKTMNEKKGIFDLNGQKVNSIKKPGIYIIDRTKELIK